MFPTLPTLQREITGEYIESIYPPIRIAQFEYPIHIENVIQLYDDDLPQTPPILQRSTSIPPPILPATRSDVINWDATHPVLERHNAFNLPNMVFPDINEIIPIRSYMDYPVCID
jgi:hypothetical protein